MHDPPPHTHTLTQQGLANVLVVPPEAVLPLVNGSLRMAHSEALKYVRLREDFVSARVDGRSLQQLLTEPAPAAGGGKEGGGGGVAGGGGRRGGG